MEIGKRIARQKQGLVDAFEEHHKRPLVEHLEDFAENLQSRDVTPG